MLRSWVEQYFSKLVSEIPLVRREEGDDIYGDDDTVHLNLEIGDRAFFLELDPPSDHDPKRAKGVLRARNGRGEFIKGDVDESTFGLNVKCSHGRRICSWSERRPAIKLGATALFSPISVGVAHE